LCFFSHLFVVSGDVFHPDSFLTFPVLAALIYGCSVYNIFMRESDGVGYLNRHPVSFINLISE
jgi:hypothetical protein